MPRSGSGFSVFTYSCIQPTLTAYLPRAGAGSPHRPAIRAVTAEVDQQKVGPLYSAFQGGRGYLVTCFPLNCGSTKNGVSEVTRDAPTLPPSGGGAKMPLERQICVSSFLQGSKKAELLNGFSRYLKQRLQISSPHVSLFNLTQHL